MAKNLTIDFVLSITNNNNPKNIKTLNLWGNKISDISILSEFPSLEIISLSTNQIKDITVFKKLKNIHELYLKDNQISDLNQIENLKNCKNLEKLVLKDNPITTNPNYIKKIIETLPQLKKLDDIDIQELKLKNNNNAFNSPLANKDNQIINDNNYIIQSPDNSKNNLSCKSGSESISSDKKGDPKNVAAAPDPQALLYQNNINNNNIPNAINAINSFNNFNENLNDNNKNNNNKQKEKFDLLNRSFKKKITEGSFRKVIKNRNFFSINNNNNNNNSKAQEDKKKQLLERSINDNKAKNEKLSQTLTSGFYKKNPFKKNSDSASNEKGGYRKKIIGNFKQEQEHKDSNNENKQNIINSVLKKYQFFDNDNSNENKEEEKKKINGNQQKINENQQKINIIKKMNKLKPLIHSDKKINLSNKNIIKDKDNSIKESEANNKNVKNVKEEKINQSVVDSIKLLMSTLSNEGLKQIQNDIQKLIEIKNKK